MSSDKIHITASFLNDDQMVEIPAGRITMRDDRTMKQWLVELDSFLLARYPVTQDLYYALTTESTDFVLEKNKPVVYVSWKDAVTICNILSEKAELHPCYVFGVTDDEIAFNSNENGYRLPTEAEWEYACKAGTTTARYGELDEIAWYKENSEGMTHEVGLKKPNTFGLYDMLGNVWEWCSDIYDETVYGSYRIFRGGGWSDEARGCLATNRRRSHPVSFKIDDLGFRLARNL